MSATTRLFAISVSKLPRRRRSRIAAAFRRLAEGCLYWLQRGVPGAIGYRLAQVAVACGLAATVAGGFAHAGGGGGGGGITDVNQRSGLVANPNIARDADGDYVTVWQAYNHDGSGWGIYGRRYRANGEPASPQFRVNQVTSGVQENPKVAMDADGDFVVVWQGTGSTGNGIWGRRFTFEGAPMGGDFNVALASGSEFVGLPDVAMDAHGNFVVAWTQGTGNYDIHARRFNNGGVPAGASFMVNAANSVNDSWPAVAMDYSGDFVVAWNSYQSGYDIVARRFNAAGTAQGSQFQVNDPVHPYAHFHQYRPDVAMDVDGDFVIAWVSDGQDVYWYYWSYSSLPYFFSTTEVQWRRYNAAGALQGGDVIASSSYPYIVNTGAPSVAMDADGDFVIAYAGHLASYWSPWSADYETRWVGVIEYRADGSFSDSRTPAFSYSWGSGSTYYTNAAVAMDADGDYVIAWRESYNYWYYDIRQTGTYGLYNDHTGNAAPIVACVYVPGDHHRVRNNEVLPQNITRLAVTFSEDMDRLTVNDLSNWGLHRGSILVPINNVNFLWQDDLNRYAALLDFGATPLAEGAYQLTFSGAEDDFGNILDGNMNGAPGGIFSLNFRVGMPQQIGAEVTVHQSTSMAQQRSDVAMDADGNYVVVWQHYGHSSGSSHDIMARVFDRHGVPQTDEFIVNRTVFGYQRHPSVAMDGDGNFIVVWEGRGDYSYSPFPRDNQGIFARRFDKTGTPMGDEFWVNPEPFASVTDQNNPDVAMDHDGNFVVVWDGAGAFYSYDSSGVFMMRFDKDGGSIGSIRRVNNNTSNYQGNPAVAMDTDGDFVVVYESYNPGFFFIPSTYRIQAARFDKDGYRWGDDQITTFGEAIQVQLNPDVAMDADGDFVVVYMTAQIYQYYYSYSPAFYGPFAIHAQRFNSDGSWIDGAHPIRVDDPGFHGSHGPRVTMDEDGDFVVAWAQYDFDYYQYDVRVRRFNWLGQAQGLPFSPTAHPHERQFDPAVAMSNDGRFVVTWTHKTGGSFLPDWVRGGGDERDIRASRYGLNEAPMVIGGGIANVTADEDDPPIIVDLTAAFGDSSDPGVNLIYTVTANSNPGLVNTAINPDSGELTLTLLPDANGTATITVRATDTGGQWVEDSFNVVVAPVNDAPVLDNSSSPHGIAVAGIDAIPYEIGDVVRSSITDVDAGALKGVAIIAATGNGVWQYRVDATGTWEDFPTVSATAALLLDENDDVRFVPAAGATGTAILQYRAWDQTDGNLPGDTADVSTNGGITAYSADQDTLTLTIVDGNITVQQIINKKKEGGCAAEDVSAAPWGLLALVSLLLGGLLTGRRKGAQQ